MLLILTILGIMLLGAYMHASTAPTFVVDAHDMGEAQAWADALEGELCPLQRAAVMGLAPHPWGAPTRLAQVILEASSPMVVPTKEVSAVHGTDLAA